MVYSTAGKYVSEEIVAIPEYHKRVKLDELIIMPNHVHCIILGDYGFGDRGGQMIQVIP